MKNIRCESQITAVVVHGRGAVVTRRVDVGGESAEELECVVDGITFSAREGTARVKIGDGKARLVALRTRRDLPEDSAQQGPTRQRVRDLKFSANHKKQEIQEISERIKQWSDLHIAPRGLRALREEGPHVRAKQALELIGVARRQRERLRDRRIEAEEELDELHRQLEEAEVADSEASTEAWQGSAGHSIAFLVHLADVNDLQTFEISYVVDQARWWPTYGVHLDRESGGVTLDLEAVVAQQSGEEWSEVSLALSTASLNMDARLPQLASRRIGRAQKAAPSGFRAPPEGLDDLFAGYDSAARKPAPGPVSGSAGGSNTQQKRRTRPQRKVSREPTPTPQREHVGAAPPVESIAEMPDPFGSVSSPAGPPNPSAPMASMAVTGGPPPASRAAALSASAPSSAPGEIEPAEGWLDFNNLRLAGPNGPHRGKLHRVDDHSGAHHTASLSADIPAGVVDPVNSRGSFDYRYDGIGHYRIPSDGRGHSVHLQSVDASCRWNWRCVPRVEPAVYREVHFINPLEAALLDGPARVFVDGEFLCRSKLDRVDRGGELRLGLGEEERVQVTRNARFDEEGAGLLGGKRCLDHDVEIRLRSSLSTSIEVEVIDRVPVTDDENVKVSLVSEEPAATEYDQRERRGRILRGGRSWSVPLTAGGEASVVYKYQIQIRTKDELVGGNRRE